jgi:thymidylate synthase
MHFREVTQSRQAYIPWLQELQDFGDVVDVRGRTTREFLNCVTVVKEPWHHCILLPSRRWNPWLALSEALWILAGRDDIQAIQPYNSSISDYSDDGVHLYGAYGKRIYHQIDDLIGRLKKDPSDRAAVLQIWDNSAADNNQESYYHDDLTRITADRPCNNMVYFKLRQNKLHMTVINRSNDLHYGLMAVNLPTFGILQSYIAARLGVDIGTQTHFSNSLHIYTDDSRAVQITDRMLYKETENMPKYPEHINVFEPHFELKWVQSHKDFADKCSEVLDAVTNSTKLVGGFSNFQMFAYHFLKAYKEKDILAIPATFPEYNDWFMSGIMFGKNMWK